MAVGASSSNAISLTPQKYDVFLSFRGKDTRHNFVSHLQAALCRKKLKTYIDDEDLDRGHEIANSLMLAIQESQLSIIVFSKNYASSSWCLDELVHILQCKERRGQIVLPVFYHVKPAHIRKQRKGFGRAFSTLKERFKDRKEKVEEWKVALTVAANLCGWDSSNIRSEAELVEKIVEDVLRKLNNVPQPRRYFKGLVGIDKRIAKVESLLSISGVEMHVRIIGIWGMGGIGKTTLARAIFHQFSSRFEGCCFLECVRERWSNVEKQSLENKLLSELLEEKSSFYNPRDRLRNKRVFVVLDDVNDPEQLKHLFGDRSCFGGGSRIIVTTRDLQMLRYIEADAIYKVEELDRNEAVQLFLLNAFKGNFPTAEDIKLSKKMVNYARGIPLALEVLGSLVRCNKRENWEALINELRQAPNDKIQNVLKVSYVGLSENERQIFLDIACFFKDINRVYVEQMLHARGFSAKKGIDVLIDKSLVTITYGDIIRMHDLVQEVAWEIVGEPWNRSRLWNAQNILHVLKNKTGSEATEGILLDTSEIEEVDLSPEVFEKMCNLKFLQIKDWKDKLHFPQGLQYLPDTLRCLHWCHYPLETLPSDFTPQNLVELEMSGSQLRQLWNGEQPLVNLRHVNLSYSEHLSHIPDLSLAPNLECVNLAYCKSLVEVPSLSFKTFGKHNSEERPRYVKFYREPGSLILDGCYSLKSISNLSGNIKYLYFGNSLMKELPASIWSLGNLIMLDLNCSNITSLSSSVCKLESLKYLDLSYCYSLDVFPELPRNIVELNLYGSAIEQVPSSIGKVSTLEVLNLSNCEKLTSLPTSICKLKSLRRLDLFGCSNFQKFPEILEPMESLRTLDFRQTGIDLEQQLLFENLCGLHNLLLDSCEILRFLPNSIISLKSLRRLSLGNCPLVDLHLLAEILESLGCLPLLEILDLRGNSINRVPPSIKDLPRLMEFQISNCKNLKSLPELPLSLGLLDASGCTSLETVTGLESALVKCHWDKYQVTEFKEFLFCDCSELDQLTSHSITVDSQIRILLTATTPISEPDEVSCILDERPSINLCCPGNEIPTWFGYQSEQSSITIKLPPNWHTNFIGFALCAVVAFEDCHFECEVVNVQCEFCFKFHQGKSRKFLWWFQDYRESDLKNIDIPILNSDHMFMWYKKDYFNDYFDAVEVSFNFLILEYNDDRDLTNLCDDKFRRCGIRLLHLQDAEEFGICYDPHLPRELDPFDEAEPRANATHDTESDEPHLKKTKFSNL